MTNAYQQQEYNEVYTDILKACQSFYELPRNPCASGLKLSPRLEDGLLEMNNSTSANPQDPVMDAIQDDDGCCMDTGTSSSRSEQPNEARFAKLYQQRWSTKSQSQASICIIIARLQNECHHGNCNSLTLFAVVEINNNSTTIFIQLYFATTHVSVTLHR